MDSRFRGNDVEIFCTLFGNMPRSGDFLKLPPESIFYAFFLIQMTINRLPDINAPDVEARF